MPSADAAARRIPACSRLFAASLLLREMCRVPGVAAVPPCREGGCCRCCRCCGCRSCGFFSSGADAPLTVRSLWRNGRARWTSNPEVPGSSPGRDDLQAGVSFLLVPFPCQDPIWSIYNVCMGREWLFLAQLMGSTSLCSLLQIFLLHHLPLLSFLVVSPPSRCFNPSAVPFLRISSQGKFCALQLEGSRSEPSGGISRDKWGHFFTCVVSDLNIHLGKFGPGPLYSEMV